MTIAELGTFIEVLQHIRATVESLKVCLHPPGVHPTPHDPPL
jgi:hypothetical protein